MKDLKGLVMECVREQDALGIKYSRNITWKVSSAYIRKWGQCKRKPDGTHEITIALRLLDDSVSDEAVKTTIHHELLHSVKECSGHGEMWKRYASKLNRRYGYNIKRTSDNEEKGVEMPEAKYIVKCEKCGAEIGRYKMSRLIEDTKYYRCTCGGRLTRIK